MSRIGFLIILLVIYFLIDSYNYYGLKGLFNSKIYPAIYFGITLFFIFGIVRTTFFFQDFTVGVRPLWINLLLGITFTIFVIKLFLACLFLIYDSGRVVTGLAKLIGSISNSYSPDQFIPSRRKIVTGAIAGIAAVPFLGFLYGITRGKYNYKVNKLTLNFPDLPKAFEGFRLVQISDIHAGSYDSVGQVQKGIDMINELNPDMVVFTGDLVNSDKDEIDPYKETFNKINSKYGNYSITGNHDYYGNRSKEGDGREEYWSDFQKKHADMGFTLLLNENREIKIGQDSIKLLGVENWGKGPFPRKGDLNLALKDVEPDDFCVLLSHDPTHWDEKTLKNDKKVHLTLAGHTHGMQFGVSALGVKWSPIKYRYKKWAGLYNEQDQYLYINKGFGFLGFPGRVGMWPEITEITLRKA